MQAISALLVLLAVWGRDGTHRAVGMCLLLWWALSAFSQHVTGLYSPVIISFLLTALVAHFTRIVGRTSGLLWPYLIFEMMICAMTLHLSYWVTARHIDMRGFQFEYQSISALIFYLCLGWLFFHDRKIKRVSKFY